MEENFSMDNRAKLAACIGTVAVFIAIASLSIYLMLRNKSEEDAVYKETKVGYGSLTVGITKEASIAIGTKEQTFDLDISALVNNSSTSGSSSTSAGMPQGVMPSSTGGAGMMSFGSFGTSTQNSQSQSLEVESVLAAVGQEIKEGTPLYTLTSESVDEIRKEFSDDIDDTKADYEVLKVSQEESKTQAKQKYDT